MSKVSPTHPEHATGDEALSTSKGRDNEDACEPLTRTLRGSHTPSTRLSQAAGAARATAEIRRRIARFYKRHNPGKIGDLEDVFSKYRGREMPLLEAIHQKYRVPMEPFSEEDPDELDESWKLELIDDARKDEL